MSQLLDRQFLINNVIDRIEALEHKLRALEAGTIIEIMPDEDPGGVPLNLNEGPDIDLVGSRIGRGGDSVLVFFCNGDPVAEYASLEEAITAATSGDTIVLPSQTITLTAGVTLGTGVALVGMSDKSIISASGFSGTAITMAADAICWRFGLIYVSSNTTGIGINACFAGAIVRDVTVSVDLTEPTFPTTGILDDFNRADEGPPPSANWLDPLIGGGGAASGAEVFSNECRAHHLDGNGVAYWNASIGPDCEGYFTISSLPALGVDYVYLEVSVRATRGASYWVGTGYTLGVTIYMDGINTAASWVLRRFDNATTTLLSNGVIASGFEEGVKIGISAIGDAISGYYCPSGGAWTLIDSVTDATYAAAGMLEFCIQNTGLSGTMIDDFGGGTI